MNIYRKPSQSSSPNLFAFLLYHLVKKSFLTVAMVFHLSLSSLNRHSIVLSLWPYITLLCNSFLPIILSTLKMTLSLYFIFMLTFVSISFIIIIFNYDMPNIFYTFTHSSFSICPLLVYSTYHVCTCSII